MNEFNFINIEFLYEIGQKVKIDSLDIKGVVIAYFYDKNGPQYRISYWYNGDRKECWARDDELRK